MSKKGPILINELISKIASTGGANYLSQSKSEIPSKDAQNAYQFISKGYQEGQTKSSQQHFNGNPNGNQSSPRNSKKKTKQESNGNPNGNLTVIQTVIKNTPLYETPFDKIMRLGEIESRILHTVVDSCVARGLLVSSPLKPEFLSKAAGTTKKTTKTCAQRLVKKVLLKREGGRDGKGGWTIFGISEATRNTALQISKIAPNGNLTVNKTVIQTVIKQESKQESEPSSSSSINVLKDLNTTTTSEEGTLNTKPILSDEWGLISISSLEEIGFTKTHLAQLAQHGKLTSEQVKDSMDAFAFDLSKNQKAKLIHVSPLNFFMGILRKGMPYTPPENYESPEDEAFRKYLESKRVQLQRRKAMEQELIELEFQEWSDGLTADQRKELAPQAKINGSEMQISTLREYFLKQVYSQHQNESVQVIRRQIDQSLGMTEAGEGVISQ
jgi:hypothetical protein